MTQLPWPEQLAWQVSPSLVPGRVVTVVGGVASAVEHDAPMGFQAEDTSSGGPAHAAQATARTSSRESTVMMAAVEQRSCLGARHRGCGGFWSQGCSWH